MTGPRSLLPSVKDNGEGEGITFEKLVRMIVRVNWCALTIQERRKKKKIV